jgi:phage major head subunit gpT-like protein
MREIEFVIECLAECRHSVKLARQPQLAPAIGTWQLWTETWKMIKKFREHGYDIFHQRTEITTVQIGFLAFEDDNISIPTLSDGVPRSCDQVG